MTELLVRVVLSNPRTNESRDWLWDAEVFADRAYTADGNLAPRALPGAVIHDAQRAAEHALRLASGLPIRALDTGAELRLRADSICVHGDKPSAVAQACGVRDALLAEGFTLCPLPEVVGSRLEKNLRTVS